MAEKFYSVAEANALLPDLRPLLERVRQHATSVRDEKTLATIREKATHNGGGVRTQELAAKAQTLERDLKQLESLNVILRDPSTGLIDFPHKREGATVFLCWKLGESRMEWWHPVDTGIAGRQRL